MNVRSLRFRMACLYVLALTMTLVASGIVVYRFASRALHGDLDDLLELRAEGIAASIDTFWTVESEAALQAVRPLGSTSKVGNADFARLAGRWVEERIDDPVLVDIVVQLFGPDSRLIAASRSLPGATLLPFEALAPPLAPNVRFQNILGQGAAPGARVRFRALTLPVAEDGRLAYVIRVLGPLDTVDASLRRLRLILVLVLPLAVILSGAAGTWLAGRALRPVDRMAETARGISAENLAERLPVPATRDELSRLAETFNGMLGRIEEGVSLHRQFWEDVAHELKTPLTIMKGEIEVALRTAGAAREERDVLASSLEEVDGLIRLIDKLLTLARMDRGGAPFEAAEIDVAALAGRAVEEFRALAEDKGLGLVFNGRGAARVRGDEARLRGLVLILLDNAVKFTPPGGAVRVEVAPEEDGTRVRLTVSDTGPGVPEAERASIFDRFQRAGRASGHRGFGLGLSIARAVAEAHGGRIEVRSRAGAGSDFIVSLPSA